MGVSVRLDSHVKEAQKRLDEIALRRMHEAVNAVENTVKEKLSGEGRGRIYRIPHTNRTYQASAPGDPPAQRLGELRQSIKGIVETSWRGQITGKVGTNKDYGPHLEYGTSRMRPRPWLNPSFLESLSRIHSIFNKRWL